jgi:hypothetical protein
MSGCKGLHCDGCRHGTGAGIGALVLLIGVLLFAAHRRAIDHAFSTFVHIVVEVLTIGAVTVAGAAVTAGSLWVIRRQHARRLDARQRAAVTPLRTWVISDSSVRTGRPAIEAPGRRTARHPYLRALPGWQHDDGRSAAGRRTRGERGR